MKIAVCLSGQPRTIAYTAENIKHYFSEYEVDYFCHAWNYNTYKRKKENAAENEQPVYWENDTLEDYDQIHSDISRLNPRHLVISDKRTLSKILPWSSLFYSCMMANHYKKMYEYQNNFRYDLVFRARFDTVFNPNCKFIIHPEFDKDNYLDIYGLFKSRESNEYNRINVSDYLFYGSSTAMDLISDVFKYVYRENFMKQDDCVILGPGTIISEVCNNFNIYFKILLNKYYIDNTIYRKEMIPLNPMTEYDRIRSFNQSFYKI